MIITAEKKQQMSVFIKDSIALISNTVYTQSEIDNLIDEVRYSLDVTKSLNNKISITTSKELNIFGFKIPKGFFKELP